MKVIQLVQLREPRWAVSFEHDRDSGGRCHPLLTFWKTDLVVLGVEGVAPVIAPVNGSTIIPEDQLSEVPPPGLTPEEDAAGECERTGRCLIHETA